MCSFLALPVVIEQHKVITWIHAFRNLSFQGWSPSGGGEEKLPGWGGTAHSLINPRGMRGEGHIKGQLEK